MRERTFAMRRTAANSFGVRSANSLMPIRQVWVPASAAALCARMVARFASKTTCFAAASSGEAYDLAKSTLKSAKA